MRRRVAAAALAGLLLAWPATLGAASLVVTKTATVVADGVNAANPKALPGALVDYALTVTNPAGNALATVAGVTVVDPLPAAVKLRVIGLDGNAGPIEFADGNLLGLGLLGSGLALSFVSLASTADGVDFSTDGIDWTYVPVPDAAGFDARVRAIRVRLAGSQTAASGFRLRYRVAVR